MNLMPRSGICKAKDSLALHLVNQENLADRRRPCSRSPNGNSIIAERDVQATGNVHCVLRVYSMRTPGIVADAQDATDALGTRLDIIFPPQALSSAGLCLGGYTVIGAAVKSQALYI